MRIYRVGGAVRDLLLGKDPKDYDFVVVGATVEQFLQTFPHAKQIGKSFPVFQVTDHNLTFEYAFARKERKVGAGHQGFEAIADPSVTLEEDLQRRDLTINAMALPMVYQNNGPLEDQVIDPYGGLADLKTGVLRHVSSAFSEDPLRVYRLARFAAQLGFQVAPETAEMARSIPARELYALSGERVGEETRKAMRSDQPTRYFEVLLDTLALGPWFPELLQLVGTPAGPAEHHRELDSFVHTMMALDVVCAVSVENEDNHDLDSEIIRFATLTHDLGKGITPREKWPSHPGHDEAGVPLVERFYDRLRLPAAFKAAAVVACAEHMRVHVLLEMRKTKWVDIVQRADRTKLKAEGLACVCLADSLGREAMVKDVAGPKALMAIGDAVREETGHPIPESLHGEHIGLHIRHAKGKAAKRHLKRLGML